MTALGFSLVVGGLATLVGAISGMVALVLRFIDRHSSKAAAVAKQSIEERRIAVVEMESVINELAKMNKRYQEALDDCLRAKERLEQCKDEADG